MLGRVFKKERTISTEELQSRKMMPEEVELMGYYEEDRRDWIRQEVMKERQRRLRNILGTANYGNPGRDMQMKKIFKPKAIPKPNYLKPYSFNCK